MYALDTKSGKQLWQFRVKSPINSSPLIASDKVVLATKRGRLHLVDLETGDEIWEFETGGSFVASPIVVDDRLIIGNTNGTLYCFGSKD